MLNNQQLMQQMTPENRAMLSNVYNNYIRRLQCNLATLNYLYENTIRRSICLWQPRQVSL